MEITIRQHNGQVNIKLKGRMDIVAANEVKDELSKKLVVCGLVNQMTCDASELNYISSSGLRVILQLSKTYPNFSVIEVQPDIYRVFEMTGFTKIINIERAMRHLSIDGCEMIGIGGVGVVYRISDDTIIKIFREGTTLADVKNEINMAKETFVLGMPTAISFDVVRVGNQYGLVYELLKADTLSSCIMKEPNRMDEFAIKYAQLFRQLHHIRVPYNSLIHDAMEKEERMVKHISRYFDSKATDLMMQILNAVPQANRLLHCDLQTKNIMMQDDEPMLIDMGEVGYGHPMLDLGHACSAMTMLVGDYETIIGMPKHYGQQIWKMMIHHYFEGESPEDIAHRCEQIAAVGNIRSFTWLALSDSFPESVIRECQDIFDERIGKKKDYLLDISKTFYDWKL